MSGFPILFKDKIQCENYLLSIRKEVNEGDYCRICKRKRSKNCTSYFPVISQTLFKRKHQPINIILAAAWSMSEQRIGLKRIVFLQKEISELDHICRVTATRLVEKFQFVMGRINLMETSQLHGDINVEIINFTYDNSECNLIIAKEIRGFPEERIQFSFLESFSNDDINDFLNNFIEKEFSKIIVAKKPEFNAESLKGYDYEFSDHITQAKNSYKYFRRLLKNEKVKKCSFVTFFNCWNEYVFRRNHYITWNQANIFEKLIKNAMLTDEFADKYWWPDFN